VEETILEHLPKKTLTLPNFCIRYSKVEFLGTYIGTSFHLPTRNYENLTNLIIVTWKVAKNGGLGGTNLKKCNTQNIAI